MSAEVIQQIESLLPSLSRGEKLQLINLLLGQVKEGGSSPRISLAGMWKGKVPGDFDIDQALTEIRGEWLEELDWIEHIERCLCRRGNA
jgi:hypothetical protein